MTRPFVATEEQTTAVELATLEESLAIEALAGAGKTSTLRLISDALPRRRGRYVSFTTKIVDDAKCSFPRSVTCSTAHSLAFRAIGHRYSDRLNQRRITLRHAANNLGLDLDTCTVFEMDEETIEIQPETLTAMAKQAVDSFCMSADHEIDVRHVQYVPGLDRPNDFTNNDRLSKIVVPLAEQIWADLQDPEAGAFRFEHNHYLKIWHLDGPVIDADYIMFDECQDANPVMMAIVEAQDCQKIWVGDTQQSIYGWNGAVNALASVDVVNKAWLTRSFRFGPEIAAQANLVLSRLGASRRVIGAGPNGHVRSAVSPDVYLGRTNGAVVGQAIYLIESGVKVCIQGGTKQVLWFAKEAERLQAGFRSSHPELACFSSWAAVRKAVEKDGDSDDLRVMVALVDRWGASFIQSALSRAVSPDLADVTVSTAHKAKGAEWGSVALLADFPAGVGVSAEELRLLYVAATRARSELDRTLVDLEGGPPLTWEEVFAEFC